MTTAMHLMEYEREGLRKGIAIGEQKGAHNKAIEIAQTMLSMSLDINLISQISQLSVEEIQSIKQ